MTGYSKYKASAFTFMFRETRSLLRLWVFAALYAAKTPINGLLTEFAG
jgi:hypothetical protein